MQQLSLWTPEEDAVLTSMKSEGATDRDIAEKLNKTEQAVRGRRRRIHGVKSGEPFQLNLEPVERPRIGLRAAVFDIETTSFKAGGIQDHLVCVCILPLDSDEVETYTIQFGDKRDDKRVLKEAMEALSKYTILIGHNATAFDSGWLMTRLAYHGLSAYSGHRFLIYDTYQASRRIGIKSERKSMAFLCDFFRIPFVKTAVYPVAWDMIDSPRKAEFDYALENIVYHCAEDVKANRNLFNALWPMDRSMTNLPVLKKL